MKATQLLHNLGQSIWLDNITRDLLDSGILKRYIEELSVTGLTSNPTIFDHAIKNGGAYDAAIRDKLGRAKSAETLFSGWRWTTLPGLLRYFDQSMTKRIVWTGGCLWKFHRCWHTTRPRPSPQPRIY